VEDLRVIAVTRWVREHRACIGVRPLHSGSGRPTKKGKRGAILPTPAGKTRITIRLDDDILEWFRDQADAAGGGNYQSMHSRALQRLRAAAEREPVGRAIASAR
jgi:uncharacterized protein (DUF4415 family)